MKPPLQSRLFWCTVAATFLSAASAALTSTAPVWVTALLAAGASAASAGAAYLRTQDGGGQP